MSQPANVTRTRPDMPDYGITSEKTDGMLEWDWVSSQMEKSRNYWVCTTRVNGLPHAAPIWGVWIDDTLYFSTGRTSVKGRNIARRNQVVVHLESGDDTVIIEGKLIEVPAGDPLRQTIFKVYADKYGFDPGAQEDDGSGVWYRLAPDKIMTWLESDFANSVTYWLFDDV